MATKMRLQRFGKKGQAYFHIVIADGRAPRDGRFIEKIGTYNPITRPADIQIDFDRALYWVKTGVEPTETVEAILKYTGVAYMHHLLKGVAKGAMTEEQAQAKFEEWKTVKTGKIESAKNDIGLKAKTEDKKRFAAEVKVNQAKADVLAKKLAAEAKKAAGVADEEVEEEEEVAEAVEETPEVVAEVAPEVVAEVAPEVVAEVAPEVVAEVAPEVVAEVAPEVVAEVAPEVVAEVAPEVVAPEAPATEEKA
ncbi:MAG: 30S ribosomal protein S16 [Bacteroidales bacterium]|nr:30S ribosomal protein S16 [Bacteroidales bacterium]